MKQPRPYLKKSHRAWFANIGPGKRPVRLASQEEGESKAYDKYHSLMAGCQPLTPDCRVCEMMDRFLDAKQPNWKPPTYQFYCNALSSFGRFVGSLRVSHLKPHHVEAWLNQCHRFTHTNKSKATDKPISLAYRCNLIRAVKAAFRWAERQGHLTRSPIWTVERPTPPPRDVYLMPDQWDKLVALVAKSRDKGALLDIITVMKETGCRPTEARCVESRHFNRKDRCWIFPTNESKGERESRVVLLTDKAYAICQRLALKYPKGPIFRTSIGTPFTRHSFGDRLYQYGEKLGFRVCPYAVRHTFATDAIIRGVDLQTIASLMGHSDLKMLSRIYQHLRKRSDHLRAGLQKAVGA